MSMITMRQAKVRYNYNDYLLLPEEKRYEILDGELSMIAAPGIRHQRVSLSLAAALYQHVKDRNLGQVFEAPCDVVLSQEDIVQPDILFVGHDHASIIGEANLRGAPDLVVEILSATTRSRDLELKRKAYARFGIQEYWIVDPEADTVEVLVWSEQGYATAGIFTKSERLSSPLLPGFDLPLTEIFV